MIYFTCHNVLLVYPYYVKAKVAQSCPAVCDCSLPGSSVRGIPQVRILEWVAVPFSRDLPNPGVEQGSPALQVDSLPAEPLGKPECM